MADDDLSPERELQAAAQVLRARAEQWLKVGDGLHAMPHSQHAVMCAFVGGVMLEMGPKLGTRRASGVQLEADASQRVLAERTGASDRTVWSALRELRKSRYLVRVGKAKGPKAQRWRLGAALWREVLGESVGTFLAQLEVGEETPRATVSTLRHTTPSISFYFDGSAPAREGEKEEEGLSVVVCRNVETLGTDAFTAGRAGLHGLNDSGRRVALALRGGSLRPCDLVRATGYSRATVWRVLKEMTRRGLVVQCGSRFALVETALEDACHSTRRHETLVELHERERAAEQWVDYLQRLREAKLGKEAMKRSLERQRRGDRPTIASAFVKPSTASAFDTPAASPKPSEPAPPAPLELVPDPPPQVSEATPDHQEIPRSTTPRVDVAAVVSTIPDVAAPVERPTVVPLFDHSRFEESKRRFEAAHPGLRPTAQPARKRRRSAPQLCRHDDHAGDCGVCKASRALEAEEAIA